MADVDLELKLIKETLREFRKELDLVKRDIVKLGFCPTCGSKLNEDHYCRECGVFHVVSE